MAGRRAPAGHGRHAAMAGAQPLRAGRAGRPAFGTLSGGQQARFQILLLELSGATLLLLDEPTDNLDLDSAEALEEGLDAFEGTVLAVTHDRWFARSFDRFLVYGADGSVYESDGPGLGRGPGGPGPLRAPLGLQVGDRGPARHPRRGRRFGARALADRRPEQHLRGETPATLPGRVTLGRERERDPDGLRLGCHAEEEAPGRALIHPGEGRGSAGGDQPRAAPTRARCRFGSRRRR